jgi:hypothetical protein
MTSKAPVRQGRNRLSRLLLAVCLSASGACAAETGGDTSSQGSERAATRSPDGPSTQTARSVTVTASGGLTGKRTVRHIDARHALADEVLPLTEDRSIFSGLSSDSPPCCDHVSYKVVVDYPSGRDYSFLTWSGADVPAEVERLVAAATS